VMLEPAVPEAAGVESLMRTGFDATSTLRQ
jgi:hypothetical protein